jgi:hypothetical protein
MPDNLKTKFFFTDMGALIAVPNTKENLKSVSAVVKEVTAAEGDIAFH